MSRRPAEQRISDRVLIGAPATIKWGDAELTGYLELANLAGGYVATPRAPDLGEYIELNFSLPGDRRTFRVRGSVVFIGDSATARNGFGARFERPPAALLDAIKNINRGGH